MQNEANQLELEEVFPHILQKGSCDRCKNVNKRSHGFGCVPLGKLFLRFRYVLGSTKHQIWQHLSSRFHHALSGSLDPVCTWYKCHAREKTRIFNMAEHWELNKRVTRTLTTMSFNCIKDGESSVSCNGTRYDLPEEALNYRDSMFWVYLGVYIALVLFAGLYEGTSDFPEEVHLRNYNTTLKMEVKYNNKENSLNNKYWLRKLRSYKYMLIISVYQ